MDLIFKKEGQYLIFEDLKNYSKLIYDTQIHEIKYFLNNEFQFNLINATDKIKFRKRFIQWKDNLDEVYGKMFNLLNQRKSMSIVKILLNFNNHKNLEKLCAMGINLEYNYNYFITYLEKHINLQEFSNQTFDILKNMNIVTNETLEFIGIDQNMFIELYNEIKDDYKLNEYLKNDTVYVHDNELSISKCLNYLKDNCFSIHKSIKYTEDLIKNEGMDNFGEALSYLYMWNYYNIILNNTYIKNPKFIKSKCDIIKRSYVTFFNENCDKMIMEQYEKNKKYEIDGYKILKSKNEILNATEKFKNCLGDYIEKISMGDCCVLCSDEYVLEIENKEIVQFKGFKNKKLNNKLISNYAEKLNLKINLAE